jgi:D-alanine transaminase
MNLEADEISNIYLNGEWIPLSEAKISPLDRGFLFSDGIYEVIPVYNSIPFFIEDHLTRLFNSLLNIEIKITLSRKNVVSIVNKLISINSLKNQIIYIQITRGVAKRNHAFPEKETTPTIFAMTSPLIRPSEIEKNNGVNAITLEDSRWLRCNIKSISLLPNVLSSEKAVSLGADEAILIKNDYLTEGAASTIWVVKNNTIYCPKKSQSLLEGIRIKLIEEICLNNKIDFKRKDIRKEELLTADEVLLTSATKEVAAVVKINNKKIGLSDFKGTPGPVFKKLNLEYNKIIESNSLKNLSF